MRPYAITAAAVAALAFAGSAFAAVPESGFIIFKEDRTGSTAQIRAKGTGQLVFSGTALHGQELKSHDNPACQDDSYALIDASWKKTEEYLVNVKTSPDYLKENKVLSVLKKDAKAWVGGFTTDCKKPKESPKDNLRYRVDFGGKTSRHATLVTELVSDGANTVSFESLADTICDGAIACTVIDYDDGQINEADIAFEEDLTRYGFEDFYTTSSTTAFDAVGGLWAISDVGTHEFGHFAGLDHTLDSPDLTMYPFMHDGDDTLGLGDMLGLLALY